ncbi:PKD domain-containing protein [Glaciecola petra]|uniref:Ig-like domain-containing protein n=1 Tax=Glaciecola petra TaxID=3075602 RepID=A0ABU2ZUD4_9ALTE|nr:Ig-like domain-containing protein [Aestuariibacter sp. P117]MDT0595929.1 Ig-like domain-containing protein [Aestuariibacter sp. P117]
MTHIIFAVLTLTFSIWKSLKSLANRSIIIVLACCSANLSASSIFSDQFINVWVVDPETQAVTTYSVGDWVKQYGDLQGFNVASPLQVLVNGLPDSSLPMTPMQAGVSIVGFGQADRSDSSFSGTSQLYLLPGSLSSNDTIEVLMQVDADIVAQGQAQLSWQINGGAIEEFSFSSEQKPDANGLYSKRIYLIEDGVYELVVSLNQAGQVLGEQRATYNITNTDPLKEKRDSDGDGVPDMVEAAIGLDPLNSELFTDTNGDGWSEFDVWLRCEELDIENCSIPNDTDGDGWSDFDENLRGTRHDDIVLTVPSGELPDDEAYNENKLLLQQKPAARRLYEIEYTFRDKLGVDKLENIQAAQLDGTKLFELDDLVGEDDLLTMSVEPSLLAPAILRSNASKSMEASQWPEIRVAAGKTLAVRASKTVNVPSDLINELGNPSQEISLLLFEGKGDVNIQDFPTTHSGQWQDIGQWRSLLIDWLEAKLVIEQQIPFSDDKSLAALLFESSLREEARIAGEDEAVRLGVERLPASWINVLEQSMMDREQRSLFDWYTSIGNTLNENPSYVGLSLIGEVFIGALPMSGTSTSEWLIERLRMPVILEEQGCFISSADLAVIQADADYFAQWQRDCPNYYTDVELAQWQAQASDLRYLLRMTIFAEGAQRIAQNDSLADFSQDTDSDTLSNLSETLQSPFDTSTYPWLEDSDGDSVSDSVDECRNDPLNLCAGDPIEPLLALGSDISVNVGNQGGIAFLELVLSSPALQEISFNYFLEAVESDGDNAVGGVDFEALSGFLTFIPGQQSMIIPASLLANDVAGNTRFRLRIEDLLGATLAASDNVQLVNINRSVSSPPNIMLAADAYTIDERAQVSFDASATTSGIGDPSVTYAWVQTSGTLVNISGANTPSPIIVAPVTINIANLSFDVTAQNAEGAVSTASVTVTVNPVDDPPVINGMPSYTVAQGENLLIGYDELLTFIEEPDGETLRLTQVVQTTDSGTLIESTEGYDYTPELASGREVLALENDPLDIRPWKDNGVAYRTANFNADPRVYKIHTWTPQEGSQVIDENSTGYSGIVTSIEQEIIYYSYTNQDTSSTFIKWQLPDNTFGEIDTGGFASLFGAQVNESNGVLYHCMDSQWERIDVKNNEAVSILLSCDRFSAGQATIDGQFCLTGGDGLYCSANGFDFEQVFRLPVSFARIDRIFSSEIGTLVLYNDITNQFIAHVDGQPNGQLLYTLDNYFNSIQGLWIEDAFYTLLPVNGEGNNEGVQIFIWKNGDTELTPVGEPDLFSDQISRNELNQLIPLGDNLLWFGQKSLFGNAKFLINRETGDFTQVGDDIPDNRTLFAWRDTALFSSARLESFCQWFELGLDGQILDINSPELPMAGCFGQIVYGDTLAYTLFDSDRGLNEFFVKYGTSGPTQTQFTVRVEDENGNGVDLVVTINITEGVN